MDYMSSQYVLLRLEEKQNTLLHDIIIIPKKPYNNCIPSKLQRKNKNYFTDSFSKIGEYDQKNDVV